MAGLTLYELPPSPSNRKARVGLGFKGLASERHTLDLDEFPGERSAIVAVSGQPRTAVLRHGETAIFDSGAILRYLEADFPRHAAAVLDRPRRVRRDRALGVVAGRAAGHPLQRGLRR